jgi:hypothetical protein
MHRRLVGGLLFAVALILAAVVPAIGGLRLAGIASPIQLPHYPRVGDCLLQTLNDVILNPPDTTGPTLAPTFAPCDGRNVGGEVVAVVRATGDVRARVQHADASGVDCYHSSLEYSGLIPFGGRYVLAGHSAGDPVDWNLTINARTAWVVPGPLLRTAGQTWVACVAAPLSGATFRGRLADAFHGGELPDEFGFCWIQNTPSANGTASCGGSHYAELVSLGTIQNGAGIAVKDINGSCQRLAAAIVGRSDPTAAGHLAVQTSVSPNAAQTSTPPQPLHVICYIEPLTYPLSGTLVGLRDRPIPYTK